MNGTARATGYGYSLWEFQVFGTLDGTGGCGTTNAAQGRPATASSTENAGTPASAAVDGNPGTRWSSAYSDPQWLQVDLGATADVCQVVLTWEAAYATAFQIQVSGQRHDLVEHLHHHDGHRRHADPRRHRLRPLRAHERHRPRHRLGLLAVGVRHRHHRRIHDDHAPPRPPRPRLRPARDRSSRSSSRSPRRRTRAATRPAAAIDGRTTTRWNSLSQRSTVAVQSTSAARPASAAWCSTGRRPTRPRTASRSHPTTPPGPPSTPPPPAPAACRR